LFLLPLGLQSTDTALKKSLTSGRNSFFVLTFGQIRQIGLTVTATNVLDMEFDVIKLFVGHGTKQIAAQLLSSGATETMTSPNVADGMDAALSLGNKLAQPSLKLVTIPQRNLQTGHVLGRQGLFDVSQERCVTDGMHGAERL
jgi:hypothetical protein